MKTITTKELYIVICWNNLRNLQPRAFLTIDEMEKTQEVIEILEEAIPEFVKVIREGEELNMQIGGGEIVFDDIAKKRKEWTEKSIKIEKQNKEKITTIELENENFNNLYIIS